MRHYLNYKKQITNFINFYLLTCGFLGFFYDNFGVELADRVFNNLTFWMQAGPVIGAILKHLFNIEEKLSIGVITKKKIAPYSPLPVFYQNPTPLLAPMSCGKTRTMTCL